MPNNFTVSSSSKFYFIGSQNHSVGKNGNVYCGAANFGGIVYRKFWGEGKKKW